jgi:hypothetical protein
MKGKLHEVYFKFFTNIGKVEVQVDYLAGNYVWAVRVNGNFIGSDSYSTNYISTAKALRIVSDLLLKYKPGRDLTLKQKLRLIRYA